MKSVSSDRIYLWSKRLGAILLLAMAIVAVGNAQQSSAGKKGKLNVVEPLVFWQGRFRFSIPNHTPVQRLSFRRLIARRALVALSRSRRPAGFKTIS